MRMSGVRMRGGGTSTRGGRDRWTTLRACLLAGLLIVIGSGCDHPRAAEARELRTECDAGDNEACFEYGLRLYRGEFVLEDREGAASRWAAACEGGEPRACVRLARVREMQEEEATLELPTDLAAGLGGDMAGAAGAGRSGGASQDIEALLRAGCEGGDMSGCVDLVDQFSSGSEALDLLERACDGGDADGCIRLGEVLSGIRTVAGPDTDSVAAEPAAALDLERAAELFASACDQDAAGCIRLADAYLAGAGVERAPDEAVSLLTTACRSSPEGCFRLGELYLEGSMVERDPARALSLLADGCYGRTATEARGEGVAEACNAHGEMLVEGDGVDRDLSVAIRSLSRACRLGWEEACRR